MDIQTAGEFYFLQRKNVPRTLSKIERKMERLKKPCSIPI